MSAELSLPPFLSIPLTLSLFFAIYCSTQTDSLTDAQFQFLRKPPTNTLSCKTISNQMQLLLCFKEMSSFSNGHFNKNKEQ